ncbi:MAG: sugar phosphate isomerase/epimerase [Bacteroidetes bacterium]|nr:sugar phosphate isomerase/epimerase [Bacteroidota bacterium]
MEILFFCPRWGQSHISWYAFAEKVKKAGYDGVETDIPMGLTEQALFLDAMKRNDLRFIAQHWETVEPSFDRHREEYAMRIGRLAAAKPLFINSQTGKDYYSFEQNKQLLSLAAAATAETGIDVYHETHRGKFSFAAHITHAYLRQLTGLELTLDISHWCAVAETLLHDQAEAVQTAIARTRHIHARIGHPQGPQVNDPRAPEWQAALNFHLQCWDVVVETNRQMQRPRLTFTVEFGPEPYMPQQPYTRQPLADQWEINLHMKDMLRKRYLNG